jgi:hypothetical protein
MTNYHVEMSGGIVLGGCAVVTFKGYPILLLEYAKSLLDSKFPGVAVLIAHVACEIAVERRLTRAYADREIPELQEPVQKLHNGFNLGNTNIRKLYEALTGDKISDQPFWSTFKNSAERRNKVAHSEITVTKDEAKESVEVAEKLVAYIGR